MCGIVGFNWEDKELIKKLVKTLKHRGPDGSGIYTDKNISLGHTRLSIIDLSKLGKQPLSSSDIWITFNGEIYNYKEKRKQLEKKGYKFKSNTDTEVILKLYEKYGLNFTNHLRGMFALAIWDKNKLILARDPLGIKPLYYYFNENKFIFSSEIKSFRSIIKLEPNKDSVIKLLAYRYTPDNNTIFKNIKKVLPGELLIFENNKIYTKKYYTQKENIIYNNLNETIKKTKEVIDDSVKNHMVADVEVGSFLSGGIDSSIISAIAQKYMKEQNKELKTFSMGFDHFSELEYSKKVAEHIKSDHYELIVNHNQAIKTIPKLIYQNDEPLIDFAAIPFYLLSEFARKKVKVVLTGIGGDEIFGGYGHYKRMMRILKFSEHAPKTAVKILSRIPNRKAKRISELLSLSNLNELYMDTYFVYKKNELMNEFKIDNKLLISPLEKNKPKNIQSNLNKILYLDQKILEAEYFNPTIDKTTMAHALEARVPYLDKEVVNLSFHINPKFKLNGKKEKFILKSVAKEIIPREIITRKKQGYGVPYLKWMRMGLGDQIISAMENPGISNLIPRELIKKTIPKIKYSETHAMRAWMLYSIEEWYKTFII